MDLLRFQLLNGIQVWKLNNVYDKIAEKGDHHGPLQKSYLLNLSITSFATAKRRKFRFSSNLSVYLLANLFLVNEDVAFFVTEYNHIIIRIDRMPHVVSRAVLARRLG